MVLAKWITMPIEVGRCRDRRIFRLPPFTKLHRLRWFFRSRVARAFLRHQTNQSVWGTADGWVMNQVRLEDLELRLWVISGFSATEQGQRAKRQELGARKTGKTD
ncbi:hypothetical protein [Cupriavidus pauculus]|uniref:hypothetical protein n=1 Tax=Cupriavidus pauculus TaxID=82633 RepID=UPI001EE3392C|nr:hypothetical protein [Cupriavidus pauculus]GJG97775.1 hypothetical protein CBA19C6_24820 [Cupriavidus pauculus]